MLVGSAVKADPGALDPVGLERQLSLWVAVKFRPVALPHWFGHDLLTAFKGHAAEVSHMNAIVRRFAVCTDEVPIDQIAGQWDHPFHYGPASIDRRLQPRLKTYLECSQLGLYFAHGSFSCPVGLGIIAKWILAHCIVCASLRNCFLHFYKCRLSISLHDYFSVAQCVDPLHYLVYNGAIACAFALDKKRAHCLRPPVATDEQPLLVDFSLKLRCGGTRLLLRSTVFLIFLLSCIEQRHSIFYLCVIQGYFSQP